MYAKDCQQQTDEKEHKLYKNARLSELPVFIQNSSCIIAAPTGLGTTYHEYTSGRDMLSI